MSVRCLIIKYPTHKGLFVLSAQFGAVQSMGGALLRKVPKTIRLWCNANPTAMLLWGSFDLVQQRAYSQ